MVATPVTHGWLARLLCKLLGGHCFYFDNWRGRVCITCGYTVPDPEMEEARQAGLRDWARPK